MMSNNTCFIIVHCDESELIDEISRKTDLSFKSCYDGTKCGGTKNDFTFDVHSCVYRNSDISKEKIREVIEAFLITDFLFDEKTSLTIQSDSYDNEFGKVYHHSEPQLKKELGSNQFKLYCLGLRINKFEKEFEKVLPKWVTMEIKREKLDEWRDLIDRISGGAVKMTPHLQMLFDMIEGLEEIFKLLTESEIQNESLTVEGVRISKSNEGVKFALTDTRSLFIKPVADNSIILMRE